MVTLITANISLQFQVLLLYSPRIVKVTLLKRVNAYEDASIRLKNTGNSISRIERVLLQCGISCQKFRHADVEFRSNVRIQRDSYMNIA